MCLFKLLFYFLNEVYLQKTLIDREIDFERVGLEERHFDVSLNVCN